MKAGEVSKGKARPRLPRASDLRPAETAGERTVNHDTSGRFTVGNTAAVEGRFKHAVKGCLGKALEGEAGVVARDARRVFLLTLRSLPSDAPPVRALGAIYARHVALNAFYTAKAEQTGLTTPEGLALLAVADRQSQRAERVLVTAQDIARVCAAEEAKRKPANNLPWLQGGKQ